MNFALNQIFGPKFSGSFNQILILDAFGQSFIQQLALHHYAECKKDAMESVCFQSFH